MYNDIISDLVTRLRNATMANKQTLAVRSSKFVAELLDLMKKSGFIASYNQDGVTYIVSLNPEQPISHIRRLSKPGIRRYVGYSEIPRPKSGLGTVVLSTPKGVLVATQARKQKVGGELLFEVW